MKARSRLYIEESNNARLAIAILLCVKAEQHIAVMVFICVG